MRSTFAGLNTMVRGLTTSQLQLDTVGHNITNTDTEGYSRQTVNTAATASQTIYGFYGSCQVGTGVNAESITRARDTYADKQYWQENSTTEYATAKQTAYGTIESIFDETDSSGLGTILSNFSTAWTKVANSASDDSVRTNVVKCGTELATKINDDVSQLQDLISTNNTAIELNVESVNQYTSSIASLNKQIVQTESTGGSANDLRDSRDLLVDKLSALVNVDVTEKSNGSYSITSSGNTLVDGEDYTELATTTSQNSNYGVQDVTVVIKSTGTALNATDGKLKGLQEATTEAKSYMDDLGTMSTYLLTTFNTAHKAGYGLDGTSTGHNFYGDDSTTYSYDSTTGEVSAAVT
ncbi:MAG: flgK, partial [Firmicutes bacterium]|nr:flgK [Bacillota bacterium]